MLATQKIRPTPTGAATPRPNRAAAAHQLFKRYLNMNAQEHWPILKSVIADLRVELDISTKTKA